MRHRRGPPDFARWFLGYGRKAGGTKVSSIQVDDAKRIDFDRPVSIWQALKAEADQRSDN